jgi:hypothetical protein
MNVVNRWTPPETATLTVELRLSLLEAADSLQASHRTSALATTPLQLSL